MKFVWALAPSAGSGFSKGYNGESCALLPTTLPETVVGADDRDMISVTAAEARITPDTVEQSGHDGAVVAAGIDTAI